MPTLLPYNDSAKLNEPGPRTTFCAASTVIVPDCRYHVLSAFSLVTRTLASSMALCDRLLCDPVLRLCSGHCASDGALALAVDWLRYNPCWSHRSCVDVHTLAESFLIDKSWSPALGERRAHGFRNRVSHLNQLIRENPHASGLTETEACGLSMRKS